jgi:hypothetical protein
MGQRTGWIAKSRRTPDRSLDLQENKGQGVVLVTAEKDPFDLWWEWINDGRLNDFENIPARIRDAVMMLTPEERENRAIVLETVRTRTTPLRPAGSADRYGVPKAEE